MRSFQVILLALSVAVIRAGNQPHHATYAAPPTVHTVQTQYVQAAPVAFAPVVPVTKVHAAPAPVHVNVVAHAPAQQVRTHEVHTSTGRQTIQLQEYQAGDQVIRVHEGPQAPPQVDKVVVPGEKHHVRVVNHASGPAVVQRTVHRQPTQVHELQKPGRPGVRIVQVNQENSPPPTVEFVNSGGSSHHVYHAHDTQPAPVAYAAPVAVTKVHAAPVAFAPVAVTKVHAAPVVYAAPAPVTVTKVHAAPVAYAAPVTVTKVHAAPVAYAAPAPAPAQW